MKLVDDLANIDGDQMSKLLISQRKAIVVNFGNFLNDA